MAEGEDAASKTEDATPKKLEDARKKGDVAKTQDLPQLMAMAAAFAVVAMAGPALIRQMAASMTPFIARPHEMHLDGNGGVGIMQEAMMTGAPLLLAVLAAASFAGVFGNVMQHGLLWTTEKMKPDLKKLDPLAAAKRMFGPDGWVQFIKSLLKIAAVTIVAWFILRPRFDEISQMSALEITAILPYINDLTIALFLAVISFMTVTAGIDWLWQRYRFMERMKMSKDELKQEYKSTEGDPLIKAKLKQMRHEKARRRMMQNVPKATVVITNPTHYAVALKYEFGQAAPPLCVAKGLDAVALKIRAIAGEHDVPIIEDPPLARALYAAIDVDEVIPEAHYAAVAKIIGFIMAKANNRARPLRPPTQGIGAL